MLFVKSKESRTKPGEESSSKGGAALSALITTLTVTKEVAVIFPPLQAAAGGLVEVAKALEKYHTNKDDLQQLDDYAKNLNDLLEHVDPKNLADGLKKRMALLSTKIQLAQKDLKKLQGRNVVVGMAATGDVANQIQDILRSLSWAIRDFGISNQIEIAQGVYRLDANLERHVGAIHDHLNVIEGNMTAAVDSVSGRGRHARAARFDYRSNRVTCESDTRREVLATVYRWINPANTPPEAGNSLPDVALHMDASILWIHGVAGSGKSTIAQTVAEWCEGTQSLAASFFCARFGDCSNVQLIFPTISYHLRSHCSVFAKEVDGVVERHPDICDSALISQLRHLLVGPLKHYTGSPHVVVIDALDECRDDEAVSTVLQALHHVRDDISPLRFIITSRPISNIIEGFRRLHPEVLRLDRVPTHMTKRDIRSYLVKRLSLALPGLDSWPSSVDIDSLAAKANDLFIFAATAVKFITDNAANDPEKQLRILLGTAAQDDSSAPAPHFHLDILYLQVLESSIPRESQRSAQTLLKNVLGTLVIMHDRLSSPSLDVLLGLHPGTVSRTLRFLHSVIIVPDAHANEEDAIIKLIHPSFQDFLLDSTRCTNLTYAVTPPYQHTLVAKRCLECVKLLKFDICNIADPFKLNVEHPDLARRIVQYMPPHLRYACRYWGFHVSQGIIDNEILELLTDLASNYLLYWIEAVSLLGDLGGAISSLELTVKALKDLPTPSTRTPDLLFECSRIIRQFFPALSSCAFQAYHCIIPFTPLTSIFRQIYEPQAKPHRSPPEITVLQGIEQTWGHCIRVLEGHSKFIRSVSFSPDNSLLVSASDDCWVCIWDAQTGTLRLVLNGHSSGVNSARFSPMQGKEIISAASDGEIIIWNPITGAQVQALRGHEGGVKLAVYTMDEGLVASASEDCTVVLWRRCSDGLFSSERVLRGHLATVNSVAFTTDGALVVSGSDDGMTLLWDLQDVSKPRQQFTQNNMRVMSINISPDDQVIASGCADGQTWLWATSTGERMHLLERINNNRSRLIWSIAFSPDSKVVATGSWENTIDIWEVSTGKHIITLHESSDQVLAVSFSPDGTLIASGGADHTIRFWAVSSILSTTSSHLKDTDTGSIISTKTPLTSTGCLSCFAAFWPRFRGGQTSTQSSQVSLPDLTIPKPPKSKFDGHRSVVRAVSFSGDGSRIATGSWDSTVRIWSSLTGELLAILRGHTQLVSFTVFFNKHNTVASAGHGDPDNTVRVWDLETNQGLHCFNGHTGGVWTVACAQDDTFVLSGSDDRSVRRWHVSWDEERGGDVPGQLVFAARGPVYALALSPDDRTVAISTLDIQNPTQQSGFPVIRLIDIESQRVLWKQNLRDTVNCFSFSRNYIVGGTRRGSVNVWRLRADEVEHLQAFQADEGVESVAMSINENAVMTTAGLLCSDESASITDTPASQDPGYFLLGEWIWRSYPRKCRVCWIPTAYRHVRTRDVLYGGTMAVHRNVIAFGTENGRVVIVRLDE